MNGAKLNSNCSNPLFFGVKGLFLSAIVSLIANNLTLIVKLLNSFNTSRDFNTLTPLHGLLYVLNYGSQESRI